MGRNHQAETDVPDKGKSYFPSKLQLISWEHVISLELTRLLNAGVWIFHKIK